MHSAHATVINGQVYVGGGVGESEDEGCLLCKYDPAKNEWSTLPLAPVKRFGVGQLNGKLVLVGGMLCTEMTHISISLTPDSDVKLQTADVHVFEDSQQWEKSIPAMPVPCRDATVLCHNSSLFVCDGFTGYKCRLGEAYMYNGLTSQWSSSRSLAVLHGSSYAVLGNSCFLRTDEKSMISTTLPSCSELQELPLLPHAFCSIATIGGSILAIGGSHSLEFTSLFKGYSYSTAAVFAYCPTTSSWVHISDLPASQTKVATATFPSGELLVVGGRNKNYTSSIVFMGSIETIP